MNETDESIDRRLRATGARWSANLPPSPPVDDALRRARRGSPHARIWAAVAAAVVVLGVGVGVGAGALVLGRGAADQRPPAPPSTSTTSHIPASTLTKLIRYAAMAARGNGDPKATAQAVHTTYGAANRVVFPNSSGGGADPKSPVWVVELRGHFRCGGCSHPSGAAAPTGTVLVNILKGPAFEATDFSLGRHPVDLSRLGRVVGLLPQPVSPKPSPKPASATNIVYFARPTGFGRVLVAVGPGPSGGSGLRLLSTNASGGDVRDIGPKVPADQYPDNAFFLDAQHGWFLTYDGGGGRETLYRTTDGGRSWHSFSAPVHAMSAPSGDTVQFVSPSDGWLTEVSGTAPQESLLMTRDGGATWQQVAQLHGNTGQLPRLGLVVFDPRSGIGWLGGGYSWGGAPLDETTDGGRHWHDAGIPTNSDDTVGSPSIFGSTLVEPVVRCAGGKTLLRTFTSGDDGSSWRLVSQVRSAQGCRQVSIAFPAPSVGWQATRDGSHVAVRRTDDGAAHWVNVTTPRSCTRCNPTIVATDANHAELIVPGLGSNGAYVYATADAGETWRRIDRALTG